MHIHKFNFFSALIFLGGLASVFSFSAKASTFSLEINPTIIQIEAHPPAKIKSFIQLNNLSYEEVGLKILLKPFTAYSSQNGEPRYLSEDKANLLNPSIFQNIHIEDDSGPLQEIVLAPRQQKTLMLSISIPKNENPSDYYFSVLFISKDTDNATLTSSQNLGGIATNVLLSIGPKGLTRGSLEEFTSPLFIEKGPVPFMVRLKNNSNHFIVPQGEILIKNMFGQSIGKVDLMPVNILSQTTRAIPDSFYFSKTASSNIDKPYSLWGENFLLGFYTAKLNIALSEKGPFISKTIQFFAFPFDLAIGLLLAMLIFMIIVKRLKRHLKN